MIKTGGSTKSKALLLEAVTELLDASSEIEKITVTDVVTAAGVTRPTFYAVFTDLPSAFAAAALRRLEAAFDGLGVDPGIAAAVRQDRMRLAFAGILDRLAEYEGFFARVLRGPGGQLVEARIVDFIAERIRVASPVSHALAAGELPVEMTSVAIAAGVVRTMTRWLERSPQLSVPELATQLSTFVEATVIGGLAGHPAPEAAAQIQINSNGTES